MSAESGKKRTLFFLAGLLGKQVKLLSFCTTPTRKKTLFQGVFSHCTHVCQPNLKTDICTRQLFRPCLSPVQTDILPGMLQSFVTTALHHRGTLEISRVQMPDDKDCNMIDVEQLSYGIRYAILTMQKKSFCETQRWNQVVMPTLR